jgi:hypothetical protein
MFLSDHITTIMEDDLVKAAFRHILKLNYLEGRETDG